MPEFVLDTSGAVQCDARTRFEPTKWADLPYMVRGYIEALFFTDSEHGSTRDADGGRAWNPETDSSLPGDVAFADLDGAALARILDDCHAFEAQAADLLELADANGYDSEQAGRDFWFTRNGHGVGFWDREALEPDSEEYERLTDEMRANRDDDTAWGAALAKRDALKAESLGERLSKLARGFREVDSYLGDDGRVHLS